MNNLVLHFSAGNVEGSGTDNVGPFTFQGTYDGDGAIVLIKRYPRHKVEYKGIYDGEGTTFGEWSIGALWRGKFALTPEKFAAPADTPIQEI